jgi:hypothetical protein
MIKSFGADDWLAVASLVCCPPSSLFLLLREYFLADLASSGFVHIILYIRSERS